MVMGLNTTFTIPDLHRKYGWTNSPNVRGTIDILWSCFLVIFTCVWTVLHINLPFPNEKRSSILLRKARWSIMCIWVPEAVMLLAAAQRQSARASVSEMHKLGVWDWTTVHGFYANMGGFVLHPPDMPPFPINSKAVCYLFKHKYIDLPPLSRAEIRDRSKADGFAKLIATIQGSWLIIQVITRLSQSLGVTPLETTTVSLALCTACSFYYWLEKPMGVESSTKIIMTTPVSQVLKTAGVSARAPWEDTPMDFVEQPGWRAWRRRPFLRQAGGLTERPIQRIPNDYVEPPLTIRLALTTWSLSCACLAVHVAGWNFPFPTILETWLWRVSSLVLLALYLVLGFVDVLTVKPGLNFDFTLLGIWQKKSTENTWFRRYLLDVPGIIGAVFYFIARMVLVAQVFATLRMMPASAYMCVDWTQMLPHV